MSDPGGRVSQLAGEYLDSSIDLAELRELEELLRQDEGARIAFLREVHFESQMKSIVKATEHARSREGERAAASPKRHDRRTIVWGLLGAIAACLAVAIGMYFYAPFEGAYPEMRADGSYTVVDGGEFFFSDAATTENDSARLILGNYCNIGIEEKSRLRIDGEDWAEEIFLEKGGMTCEVDRKKGAFAVRTEVGTVSVTGTKFTVQLQEPEGGDKTMITRKNGAALALAVAVMAGSVSVEYDGKTYDLMAGMNRSFGAEIRSQDLKEGEGKREGKSGLPANVRGFRGRVRGVVVEKGDGNTFMFKIGRVLKVWKGNKAKEPKSLAGRTVRVGPRWEKGKHGKWHPVELHVAFIRKLSSKQELTLEIVNAERDVFAILELSGEQRERAHIRGEGAEGGER